MVTREEIQFEVSSIENGLLIEYDEWRSKDRVKRRKRRAFVYSNVVEEEMIVERLCEFIRELFWRRCVVEEGSK